MFQDPRESLIAPPPLLTTCTQNNVENVKSCNIITVDLTDHLATHTKISFKLAAAALSNVPIKNRTVVGDNTNKKEFRIFNEANNSLFETLINGESWEEICDDMDAQSQYEKFDEIYMRHYNNAYPLNNAKRTRRKNERKNPKPWILPWLEDACARKNNLYHEFVNAPTSENKAKYDKMNEFCAKHIDIAKLRYRKKYLMTIRIILENSGK